MKQNWQTDLSDNDGEDASAEGEDCSDEESGQSGSNGEETEDGSEEDSTHGAAGSRVKAGAPYM